MDILRLKNEILAQLPLRFRRTLAELDFQTIQEIRFRSGRPLMVYQSGLCGFVTEAGRFTSDREQALIVNCTDISSLLAAFCENSVYAYQSELCDGFLTIRGGHRVGVSGRCVLSGGNITNVTEVSGLNLRIAREFFGCAERILPEIIRADGTVRSTILLAPPQCGKTTVLREVARVLSERFKITVIDERSEIAAMKEGVPQFQVGLQTDILDRFPKAAGMLCAVRSLSPDVMITDELGGEEDIAAVKNVFNAGCRIITSMHGFGAEELRGERGELFALFERAVVLTRKNGVPEIREILDITNGAKEAIC